MEFLAGGAHALGPLHQPRPRPLPVPRAGGAGARDAAADEAFAIAREALWNAFAHAKAHALTVTLQYTTAALTVTVADDGIGLPDDVDAERGREHHWGIVGMRERAHTLGAALSVTSVPGEGTAWTLRVPAAVAFA